jgi:hypothetical protein
MNISKAIEFMLAAEKEYGDIQICIAWDDGITDAVRTVDDIFVEFGESGIGSPYLILEG